MAPSAVAVIDNRNRVRALVPFNSFARFGRMDNGSNTVVEPNEVCVSRRLHCELNYLNNATGQPVLHVSDFSKTGTWVGHGKTEETEDVQKLQHFSSKSAGMWRVGAGGGWCMLRLMLGDRHANHYFMVVDADDRFYRACAEGDCSRALSFYHAQTPLVGVKVPSYGATGRVTLLRSAVRRHSNWLIAHCLKQAADGGPAMVDACADLGDITDAMRHAPLRVFVLLYNFWIEHKFAGGTHRSTAAFKSQCLALALRQKHYHNTVFLCKDGATVTDDAVATARGCPLPIRLALMVASLNARKALSPCLGADGSNACTTVIFLGALGLQHGMRSLVSACIADGRLTACSELSCRSCKAVAATKKSMALLELVATDYYGCPRILVRPAFVPYVFLAPRATYARTHFHLYDYPRVSGTKARRYIDRLVTGRGLWTRQNHQLFSAAAQQAIATVLLLQTRAHNAVADMQDTSTCVLPVELWTTVVLPCLKHSDWQVE
jgi:hypothetical protein